MSERRAKRERKEVVPEAAAKKSKGSILFNVIVVLVVVAVVAVGGYASYEKIRAEMDEASGVQTIEQIAAEQDMTADEFLAKLGLEDSGLKASSKSDKLAEVMTIKSFALYNDLDVAELKSMYGLEALDDNTLWSEAQMKIPMSKVAETEYGISFEEFAVQNNLPAEITGDMTQGEALEIIQNQNTAE